MSDIRVKDLKWLERIASYDQPNVSGMYPGMREDLLPDTVTARLWGRGLIEVFSPHNPVHKDRWHITPAGRKALAEAGEPNRKALAEGEVR